MVVLLLGGSTGYYFGSAGDKWGDEREWLFASNDELKRLGLLTEVQLPRPNGEKEGIRKVAGGWEPWAYASSGTRYFRKRIK